MRKTPTSAPHSPQPSAPSPSPRPIPIEKDEQLQLCIQRFVSDAQSMMNQFNEMFIGEVRRFADVCMEFSLAYRSVHEERNFLSIENQSLKDELEARTGQLEMTSKELRETREENEELVRRLECLGMPSSTGAFDAAGSPIMVGINSIRMDPVAMSRHYAVVNSMPAFPRRYSVATSVASYDDDHDHHSGNHHSGSSYLAVSHGGCSSASPTMCPRPGQLSSAGNSNTLLLITPPIDFKGEHCTGRPLPSLSSDMPAEVKRKSASLSRDDIYTYVNRLERQSAEVVAKQRSPSVDHIQEHSGPIAIAQEMHSPTDQHSMSSSAGTFYDCISSSSVEAGSAKERPPKSLTEEINLMCALMVAQGGEMTNDIAHLSSEATFSGYLEAERSSSSFVSKTPSPQATDYLHHFQLYMSKSHDDAREAAFGSGSELTEIETETSLSGQLLSEHLPKRKRSSIKDAPASTGEMIQQSKWYSSHGGSGSLDLIGDHSGYHRFPDLVTVIPLPLLELTRYLLVEVSHFISPSHFYLIVNDEKCGSNAFEDFLESFQNFYKSLDYLVEEEQHHHHENGFLDEVAEDSEWKLYFTSPPASVSVGAHFAGYMDEDYEWRRVQVLHFAEEEGEAEEGAEVEGDRPSELMNVVVRDVDSGHSSTISVSASASSERGVLAPFPAFAIRSSLAYLYPRPQPSTSTDLHHPSVSSEDASSSIWSEECCRLFEALTYDQILTASIIEIQREDLTDTELAQVLLWCSPGAGEEENHQEEEIFINRKLIELNFAANVAENDHWLLRSNESMNYCTSSKSSSQLIKPPGEAGTAAEAVQADEPTSQLPTPPPPPPAAAAAAAEAQLSPVAEAPAENSAEVPATKKKKLKKTMSKKKRESAEQPVISVECDGSSSNPVENSSAVASTTEAVTAPAAAVVVVAECKGEPNVLLSEPSSMATLSCTVKPSFIEICNSFYLSSSSLHHLDESGGLDLCKFPLESCHKLHHDPRLSNWIVQKHSRHVKLKKSSHMTSPGIGTCPYPTMCYPFRVTTVFDVNKFIGILPFGERKLDTEAVKRFISQINAGDLFVPGAKLDSPFRTFVLEMTEFYNQLSKEYNLINCNSNSTFLETFLQNQHQNQMIVFYDAAVGLYLRGYIVGKDPDTPRTERAPGSSHALNSKDQTADVSSPTPEVVKRKTLSLKRTKVKFSLHSTVDGTPEERGTSKIIVYGIDTGRYYLIKTAELFKLVDQFAAAKPFAVVCKLMVKQNADGTSCPHALDDRARFQSVVSDRLLCLQFHDIDFSTERNLVSLYLFSDYKESATPQNILYL